MYGEGGERAFVFQWQGFSASNVDLPRSRLLPSRVVRQTIYTTTGARVTHIHARVECSGAPSHTILST